LGTIRGRAVKVGGVAFQQGAAPRTNELGVVRPAFAINAGIRQPLGGAGAGFSLGHPLLDLGSVSGWRMVAVGLAFLYVVGFHVTLGRTRLGLGPAR
jgi:hypothetical protein